MLKKLVGMSVLERAAQVGRGERSFVLGKAGNFVLSCCDAKSCDRRLFSNYNDVTDPAYARCISPSLNKEKTKFSHFTRVRTR